MQIDNDKSRLPLTSHWSCGIWRSCYADHLQIDEMFAEMDGDSSGAVDLKEMLEYFGLDKPKNLQVYLLLRLM